MACGLNTRRRLVALIPPVFLPFCAYLGYYGAVKGVGQPTLPLNVTVWAVCAALALAPHPMLNYVTEFFLLRALGGYDANLWLLGFAYVLSIPVNLWAIKRVTSKADEGTSAAAKYRAATREVLKSPVNQALAMFHYMGFGINAMDFSVSGVLLGLLIDLSSGIAHLIIMKFVIGWVLVWVDHPETEHNMDARSRLLFIAVTLAEIASIWYLQIQTNDLVIKRSDAEKAEKLASEQEETWSDEKADSTEA